MQKTLVRCLLLAMLSVLVGIAPALAQYNAGFQGVVSDSTGAVIPGVKVVARNVATGVDYAAKSNAAGVYFITNLPQGTYKITAEKEGFATAQTDTLDLHTEELKGVNLTLTVGSVKQTVTVTAVAPLLNTEQARLSDDISNSAMNSLPLEGENPLSVVALTPGITGASPGNSTIFSVANSVAVNANGLQSASNNYKVDGTTVTETPNGGTMNISPDLDEIAEIHVTTNNFSAEIGRSGGFQLDMSTKSGTNQLHGDAFYYGMTARLDANSFFSNRAGSPTGGNAYKPRFDQNNFGATLGGPDQEGQSIFLRLLCRPAASGRPLFHHGFTRWWWKPWRLRLSPSTSRPISPAASRASSFPSTHPRFVHSSTSPPRPTTPPVVLFRTRHFQPTLRLPEMLYSPSPFTTMATTTWDVWISTSARMTVCMAVSCRRI